MAALNLILCGEIPTAELVGNLAGLRVLDVTSTRINGMIMAAPTPIPTAEPATPTAPSSSNKLSREIPPWLGNLASLEWLNLSGCQFSGEIPSWLGNLTNLTQLRLNNNQLSGEIPAELGNLASLRWLDLVENQISGEIPAELGNLVSLEYLWLGANQLSGCVPGSLSEQLDRVIVWTTRDGGAVGQGPTAMLGGLPHC